MRFAPGRTYRRLGVAVLGIWLVVLAVGIAKACLPAQAAGGHAFAEHAVSAMSSDGASLAALEGQHDLVPASDGNAACDKFCDEESRAVPKHDDAGSLLPALLAAVLAWVVPVSRAARAPTRPAWRPWPPQPPATIRFLRLTI